MWVCVSVCMNLCIYAVYVCWCVYVWMRMCVCKWESAPEIVVANVFQQPNTTATIIVAVEFRWNENCELSMKMLLVAIVRLVRRYSFHQNKYICMHARVCSYLICEHSHFHSYISHQGCKEDTITITTTNITATINTINSNARNSKSNEKFAIFIFIMDGEMEMFRREKSFGLLLFQVLCTYSLSLPHIMYSMRVVGGEWHVGGWLDGWWTTLIHNDTRIYT